MASEGALSDRCALASAHGVTNRSALAKADEVGSSTNVFRLEWPALARRGLPVAEPLRTQLSRAIVAIVPGDARDTTLQAGLIRAFGDVASDRRDRRLAAHGTIPDLVWLVLLSGGALMIALSFLLGGPTLGVHLAMTPALVASGVLVVLLQAWPRRSAERLPSRRTPTCECCAKSKLSPDEGRVERRPSRSAPGEPPASGAGWCQVGAGP